MPVKINGSTSGSVTLAAPATGSDVTLTLPGTTATVATLDSPTFTGAPSLPTTTLVGGGSVFAAWTAYTPAVTGSVTNPTLGTGAVQTGRYVQMGKIVFGQIIIRFGSSPNAGSGTYALALPVSVQGSAPWPVIGQGQVYDSSANQLITATLQAASATTAQIYVSATSNYAVTSAVPWTWAQNDEIRVSFNYEAA